ncbi:hypothetical protein QBC37DRAFT_289433 [Rhypophila decipiens]|uniref:Uncharacterized protein n=1 Tax=Rhypophila decipiens TaxID=261697 RepID=A0AAN6Y3H6_9PEZI|nr:hypothetical protein QBC37DRAFT_289433 [Rhypophila decipiens]
MDALQGKFDSVDNQFRQIATELRGYLDDGITGTRKVKPPGTKAGRDLLQHILGRIDQIVSNDLADARRLSISSATSTPQPQQRTVSDPDTVSSYVSPIAPSQSQHLIPQDGSPQPQQQHQPTPASTAPASDAAPQDTPTEYNESLKQSSPQVSHDSPAAVKLKADLVAPVTPITPGRGPAEPLPIVSRDALVCQTHNGPQPLSVPSPLRFTLFEHSAPLFECNYQDIHILNEVLFEQCSSHPIVRDRGYFKLQVSNLPPLNIEHMERPTRDHAQSFRYKADQFGLIKVDTGRKPKFSEPRLPFPSSAKLDWTFEEQRELWNTTAKNPPKGHRPYIIGNPLFDDIELSPGEKLRQRGEGVLEGINTQYVYFNLTGKTITTMHREDAHVRSENILRSGENKFWCFVKPSSTAKLEEAMHRAYPEMRNCSQAVRHLSRHIPPAQLDEWGVEYTLDYCVPGQAVVTEPATYHQVLNLGPNYAVAINLEYMSSPDMPPNYRFCDKACPDKFAISAKDFQIRRPPTPPEEEPAEKTKQDMPHTSHAKGRGAVSRKSDAEIEGQGSAADSASESPAPQGDPNGNLQESNTTRLAPGPTPNLTPEREHAEQASQKETFQHPEARYHMTVPEQSAPLAQQQPQQTNIAPYGPVQTLPNTPIQAPVSIFPYPYTPKQLVPKRTAEQLPAKVFESSQTVIPPPVIPQRVEQPVPPPVIPQRVEQPANMLQTAGIRRKRQGELPAARNPPQKRQRPEPVVTPMALVQPLPVMDLSHRSPFNHLATLIRGCAVSSANALETVQVCSKVSFERLASLVRDYRRYSRMFPDVGGGLQLVNHVDDGFQGSDALRVYLSRFSKLKLVEWIEEAVRQNPYVPSEVHTTRLLSGLGWPESERYKLYDYLREGKCWKAICGDYEGVLCLMAPDIPDTRFTELALYQSRIATFHSQLDIPFVRRLCEMGKILEKAIWSDFELPEFMWEAALDTDYASLHEVFPLLGRFKSIRQNQFDRGKYHWTKPLCWNWAWPVDPTSLSPRDKRFCDQCNITTARGSKNPCRCFEIHVPSIPRISDDGTKGEGIRSLGAYKAGNLLGELVGVLVPLGTYSDTTEWTILFRRPDLDDNPVAEIYTREMGNWIRKVNHSSTQPSCAFKVMKISGKWRQMLVALRDIRDGEEITAKYGRGYCKEKPYSEMEFGGE